MNKTNITLTILSMAAAVMLVVHATLPTPAHASEAVKDRDYQVVSARMQSGGDGLYILDNRTGQLAVFTYDPAVRGVRAKHVRPVADAFTPPR